MHHLALAGDVEPAGNALLDRSPVVRDRVLVAPVELLLPMLLGPAPVVTRHVVRSLRDRAYRVDESHLRELLDTRQPAHVRMAAFGLLQARDPWTRLELDLTLLADPLQPLRDQVWVSGELLVGAGESPVRAGEFPVGPRAVPSDAAGTASLYCVPGCRAA